MLGPSSGAVTQYQRQYKEDFKLEPVELTYSVAVEKRRKGKELIITNY
jgi:hypothetical protein